MKKETKTTKATTKKESVVKKPTKKESTSKKTSKKKIQDQEEIELDLDVIEEMDDEINHEIEEIDNETKSEIEEEQINSSVSLYNAEEAEVVLSGLSSISKEVKQSVSKVTNSQIRLIIDNYYQTQHHRMNLANQIRAIVQGFDDVREGELPVMNWLLYDVQNRENQIKKIIAEYVKTVPVCMWAMDVTGIGPVFAANLWSYIDMNKCHHANQLISYAGLNDNNCPWLGKEKATKIVNETFKQFGVEDKCKEIPDIVLLNIAVKTGRNLPGIKRGLENHKLKNKKKKSSEKTNLIAFLSKPPYNIEFKKMCYLIGESFVKVSNKDNSLYGRIYKERKALETFKNENGEYAEQAAKLLSEKNYSKDTDTYKYLSKGMLSPAHINARAKRYAVKIFLTHFFEACYIYTYKKNPPTIYPITFQGHVDYIEPEVPYENHFVWDKNVA